MLGSCRIQDLNMLLTIRRKSQGWVAWLIVIIIAIPFALFGINSYFEGANQIPVAKVNGENINAQTFENAMEQRRRFFRSQLGNNFDPAMVDNPQFRMQVVEGLVSNRLIQSYAQEHGLRLSDSALRESIISAPEFQQDGKFDKDTYRRVVSARGYSIEAYEQQLRMSGGIEQLQNGLSESALVNPAEVDQLLVLTLQKRDADYTVIAASAVLADVQLSDEEKRDEYAKNEVRYQQDDRLKLNYVKLNLDDIAIDIELDEEEIAQAYEASKGQYRKPEVRIASHILLGVPRSANEAKQDAVRAQAEALVVRLNAGDDFALLAEEFSEDPGSKRQGGDLGIIAKGQMVPEFEAAVYSMAEGEVSAPIKTEFGYHIIKLSSLEEESTKPYEEVRAEVEVAEKKRLARTQFSETAEAFRTLVFEEPDSLEAAALALGLDVQTSGWVTQNSGTGDFSSPLVRAAAFDAVVLDDDLNSEVISISDDVLIALHKHEFEAEHVKAFEDVAEEIDALLKQRKAAEIAQKNGESLVAALQQGTMSDEIAFNSLPELRSEIIDPIDRQVAEQVFKQSLVDGESQIKGFSLSNGDYAVYRLNKIVPGDPATATPEQREQLEGQLISRDGNNAYSLFREALRDSADVEIFTSTLEDDADVLVVQ
jgi:peptidyl-prolyl cis-trans isomerase D